MTLPTLWADVGFTSLPKRTLAIVHGASTCRGASLHHFRRIQPTGKSRTGSFVDGLREFYGGKCANTAQNAESYALHYLQYRTAAILTLNEP